MGKSRDLLPRDDGSPGKSRRVALPASPEGTPGGDKGNGGGISEAAALEALGRYFSALTDHNVNAAVDCLDPDVLVRYPEAGKGWSSSASAPSPKSPMRRSMSRRRAPACSLPPPRST
jgi:hypothetical protein